MARKDSKPNVDYLLSDDCDIQAMLDEIRDLVDPNILIRCKTDVELMK
jgi:hypothetical protein